MERSKRIVLDNLAGVRERMAAACVRADREAGSVRLVAVGKTVEAEALRWVREAGVEDLGENYVRELREKPETRDTPVVLLTAKAQEDDQLRGWNAGAAEYVTKPFSPLALTETVERVYEMSPEQRHRRRAEAVSSLRGAL